MTRLLLLLTAATLWAAAPGERVLLDAHNCYPDEGQYADRIDRALATGLPVAIEQDLIWYRNHQTGEARSVVAHGPKIDGREPSLEQHFFERIRPIIERELKSGDKRRWPVITLNIDFKDTVAEHLASFWLTLGKYEPWLTTAVRGADGSKVMPLEVKPVLVLVGDQPAMRAILHDVVPLGGKLRAFGAMRASRDMTWQPATNFLRWANLPWRAVEAEGQNQAGEWTPADEQRLRLVVGNAHRSGLWIRFYTLNGHTPEQGQGWTASYNFGSLEAARLRWQAAIQAKVDFIATDQYEGLATLLH